MSHKIEETVGIGTAFTEKLSAAGIQTANNSIVPCAHYEAK